MDRAGYKNDVLGIPRCIIVVRNYERQLNVVCDLSLIKLPSFSDGANAAASAKTAPH
jgi:hypothetical protein